MLVSKGWKLNQSTKGKSIHGVIEIVEGFLQYDGECRPLQSQAFAFVNDRLVGQLSPRLMESRVDGALASTSISDSGEILARFFRYRPTDALASPSRVSHAVYSLLSENGSLTLKLLSVETRPAP
jgi:hypothetical protein